MQQENTPNIRMSTFRSSGSSKTNNTKSMAELMKNRASAPKTKAPAYEWQEMALNIIKEFEVPANKRSSVFRVCKQYSKPILEKALGDTRELCQSGEKWKYFFKVINAKPENSKKVTSNPYPF